MAHALDRMAAKLSPRLESSNPVVLAVMYGGALEWRARPSQLLAGRTVLVVDDILDHGTTLRALDVELKRVGVAARLAAVLVVKRLARSRRRPRLDAVGVAVEDVYVFGSGMDYRGYWRELRGIYAVTEDPA